MIHHCKNKLTKHLSLSTTQQKISLKKKFVFALLAFLQWVEFICGQQDVAGFANFYLLLNELYVGTAGYGSDGVTKAGWMPQLSSNSVFS